MSLCNLICEAFSSTTAGGGEGEGTWVLTELDCRTATHTVQAAHQREDEQNIFWTSIGKMQAEGFKDGQILCRPFHRLCNCNLQASADRHQPISNTPSDVEPDQSRSFPVEVLTYRFGQRHRRWGAAGRSWSPYPPPPSPSSLESCKGFSMYCTDNKQS